MASCAVRRLAKIATRAISQRNRCLNTHPAQIRTISSSPILLQKYFSDKHEWIDVPENETVATVGITDFAQEALGDVVYVSLPEPGQEVEADGEVGVLESVKAASDLYCPITGTITDVNSDATEEPALINSSPYDKGWLFKIAFSNPEELSALMSEAQYKEFLETL